MSTHPQLSNEDIPIILHHDRVYEHATASINYTSYDLRREQDILHPSSGKSNILVHTIADAADSSNAGMYPWQYARVLGIYHANVVLPGTATLERIEFFHVRWLEADTSPSGAQARRLERLRFVAHASGAAFGFVHPSHVIRACHLIPAFHHGRTFEYSPPSMARDMAGDWKFHFVNR